MARRGRPLNRPRAQVPERSRILVVCEGEVTEVEYLQGLRQSLRASGVSIRSAELKGGGSDPLNVLKEALRISSADEFDEVWVVVDVDTHERLPEALSLARRNKVLMVVTNPCFEVWLLWHYQDCRAPQTSKSLRRALRKEGHHDEKHLPNRFPFERWADAVERALSCNVEHSKVGENPSSAMPALIKALQGCPSAKGGVVL